MLSIWTSLEFCCVVVNLPPANALNFDTCKTGSVDGELALCSKVIAFADRGFSLYQTTKF